MNLVLADTEEFRKIRSKQAKAGGAPGSGASQTVETEAKRTLGLTIVRGAHIVSCSVESPPPADPSARLGKATTGGISTTLAAGQGVARAAGRGAPAPPPSLAVRCISAPGIGRQDRVANACFAIGSCCWRWRRRSPARIPARRLPACPWVPRRPPRPRRYVMVPAPRVPSTPP